jgi:hypothetical protein
VDVRARRHCIGVVLPKLSKSALTGPMPSHTERSITPIPCPGWAHGSSEYCFLHDPAITKQQRRLIAASGGNAGRGRRRIKVQSLESAVAVAENALSVLFTKLDAGADFDPKVLFKIVHCITQLVIAMTRPRL